MATSIVTRLFVVLDEINDGDFETTPMGVFISLEKAEIALANLKHEDAYICEYKLKTDAASVPTDIIELVEWEEWNGPITVTIATVAGKPLDMIAEFVDVL